MVRSFTSLRSDSMALDYTLAIATDASPLAVAAIAVPGVDVREEPEFPGLFTADTYDSLGFGFASRIARGWWVSGMDDGGIPWEWAPEVYVSIGLRMSKD